MPKKIYLDYAATTPVAKEVLNEMLPFFSEEYGNAMSVHSFGLTALQAIDNAREQTARFFGASPSEIIFTSGATESNNLAIKGVLKSYYSKTGNKNKRPHIITTAFEHHCVLNACETVEEEGLAEVTFIKPKKDGVVNMQDIQKAIKDNTILISVMYVNNEIGTVQPIKKIGALLKKENKMRAEKSLWPIIFHTDATQAVNYFDCDVNKLGVDLLSMSAHKIYGPKGIGSLYIRKGTAIKHIQDGGDQEYKMRAGTHNVPGIVGLGKAVSMIKTERIQQKNAELIELRNHLIGRILKEIPKSRLNGSAIKRSPNNANFSFKDVEGEGLLLSLDMEGVACSTGSACSSGALSPSHVLLSIGLRPEDAHGSLRITLGKHTTKKDIDSAVEKIKTVVERLRKISGKVLEEFYNNKK